MFNNVEVTYDGAVFNHPSKRVEEKTIFIYEIHCRYIFDHQVVSTRQISSSTQLELASAIEFGELANGRRAHKRSEREKKEGEISIN